MKAEERAEEIVKRHLLGKHPADSIYWMADITKQIRQAEREAQERVFEKVEEEIKSRFRLGHFMKDVIFVIKELRDEMLKTDGR